MQKQERGGRSPGKWLAAGASAACLAVTVIAATAAPSFAAGTYSSWIPRAAAQAWLMIRRRASAASQTVVAVPSAMTSGAPDLMAASRRSSTWSALVTSISAGSLTTTGAARGATGLLRLAAG